MVRFYFCLGTQKNVSLLTFPVSRLWKTRKLENENTAHIWMYHGCNLPCQGKLQVKYKKMERSSFCPTYIRLKVPDFTDGQRKTIPQKMYKSPHEVVTCANIKKSFERTNGWAVFFLTLQKYAKFIKRNWFILVHFEKKCEKWCFLESPSVRNPRLSQISRLSARNPRLSQMRNDKLA